MRIGENANYLPVFLTVVCSSLQTNVARDTYRAATTIPKHMISVQLNLLWTYCLWLFIPGFMFQLRFDYGTISLLIFFARRSWITWLEIPGCDGGILEKKNREPRRSGDELSSREAKGSLRALGIAILMREGCSLRERV